MDNSILFLIKEYILSILSGSFQSCSGVKQTISSILRTSQNSIIKRSTPRAMPAQGDSVANSRRKGSGCGYGLFPVALRCASSRAKRRRCSTGSVNSEKALASSSPPT